MAAPAVLPETKRAAQRSNAIAAHVLTTLNKGFKNMRTIAHSWHGINRPRPSRKLFRIFRDGRAILLLSAQ